MSLRTKILTHWNTKDKEGKLWYEFSWMVAVHHGLGGMTNEIKTPGVDWNVYIYNWIVSWQEEQTVLHSAFVLLSFTCFYMIRHLSKNDITENNVITTTLLNAAQSTILWPPIGITCQLCYVASKRGSALMGSTRELQRVNSSLIIHLVTQARRSTCMLPSILSERHQRL